MKIPQKEKEKIIDQFATFRRERAWSLRQAANSLESQDRGASNETHYYVVKAA